MSPLRPPTHPPLTDTLPNLDNWAELSLSLSGCTGPAAGTERALAAVLADVMGVEQVPADSHFFDDLGADSMVMARFCARARKQTGLPSVSMKDIYQHPTISTLAAALAPAPSPVESALAAVLADVMGVEQVPADSHFFDDLGADSMVMARFCARARKQTGLPSVSMKDIYQHPTISTLAAALAPAPAPGTPVAATPGGAAPAGPAPARAGRGQYIRCGALQLLTFLGYAYLAALVVERGFEWMSAGSGLADVYLRAVLFGSASFLGMCTIPIIAKWTLIGRWRPGRIRLWSLAYVRFWIVRTLLRANPLALFAGSPLYVLYLRALGAKIGRGVVIFSRHVPVCTDLLTIGDGTVVRKDSYLTCYRAEAGTIRTGTVTLGRNAFVGEVTVLDIETSLGDGAQLGHSSALHAGQAVPDGECWHGSPAQRAGVDYRVAGSAGCGTVRRTVYSLAQLLNLVVLYLPLAIGGVAMLLTEVPRLAALLTPGAPALTSWTFYTDALAGSFVLFFGAVLAGLLLVTTVPRLLNLAITPGRVYRLYGFHYGVQRAVARITNIKFFGTSLFGDSSYIVHYLRGLGYDLSQVEQTGSNFGTAVRQETPYLCTVGRGTMVADGLSIINADFSSTSFRVSRASIGPRNFLGNHIAYPSQGRTGDNCLLATKVMVPVDGPVREGVGLLGSPSFEIPRSVQRDSHFDHLKDGDALRDGLAAKNRHNLVTIGLYLLTRWIYLFGVLVLAMAAADLYNPYGAVVVALANVLILVFSVGYWVLVEHAVRGFRPLRPLFCSIYERGFWRVERVWKVPSMAYLRAFDGTPFKNTIWRLLGVRIGARVFDDGCQVVDRTLITIGSDCTLNLGSVLQPHSQEDGAFKSDRITVGDGCTVGVGALVHYGVTMGDGAGLAPDSFLMKGEEIPAHAQWGGNPARDLPGTIDTALSSGNNSGNSTGDNTVAAVIGGTSR